MGRLRFLFRGKGFDKARCFNLNKKRRFGKMCIEYRARKPVFGKPVRRTRMVKRENKAVRQEDAPTLQKKRSKIREEG